MILYRQSIKGGFQGLCMKIIKGSYITIHRESKIGSFGKPSAIFGGCFAGALLHHHGDFFRMKFVESVIYS